MGSLSDVNGGDHAEQSFPGGCTFLWHSLPEASLHNHRVEKAEQDVPCAACGELATFAAVYLGFFKFDFLVLFY